MSKWQLPEGIDELVGSQAESFEKVRRSLLDLYQNYGYKLAIPPIVEYIDTLELLHNIGVLHYIGTITMQSV